MTEKSIYCTACSGKVTLRADATFSCACKGPIDPMPDSDDAIPATWEMAGEDADGVLDALVDGAARERAYRDLDRDNDEEDEQ